MNYTNQKLLEYRRFLCGKSVSVIGVGISNIPLIEFLLDAGAKVVARDMKSFEELCAINPKVMKLHDRGTRFITGEDYLGGINEDIVFKSPGIRFDKDEIVRAMENGALITSEMEAFLSLCPSKIIAVTGSDGKTTTTTLTAKILEAAGKKVWLGGNIGKPLLPEIDNITPDDFTVLELSSFQLHTINKFKNESLPFAKITFPDVAIVTNVTPNHLNWHTDMQEYIDAKRAVFSFMDKGTVVTNCGNDVTREFEKEAKKMGLETRTFSVKNDEGMLCVKNGEIRYCDKKIIDVCDILLPGEHNVENYMAAIGATLDFVTADDVKRVAAAFGGVEHRLEFVREFEGVKYYNSSIDSSPARTMAALSAFGSELDKKIVLILGGKDKNLDFTELADVICDKARAVFISHDTETLKVYNTIKSSKCCDIPVYLCDGFDDAFWKASGYAGQGDVVLLSPAMTSFDEFLNFEMRGKRFKSLVASLKEE